MFAQLSLSLLVRLVRANRELVASLRGRSSASRGSLPHYKQQDKISIPNYWPRSRAWLGKKVVGLFRVETVTLNQICAHLLVEVRSGLVVSYVLMCWAEPLLGSLVWKWSPYWSLYSRTLIEVWVCCGWISIGLREDALKRVSAIPRPCCKPSVLSMNSIYYGWKI